MQKYLLLFLLISPMSALLGQLGNLDVIIQRSIRVSQTDSQLGVETPAPQKRSVLVQLVGFGDNPERTSFFPLAAPNGFNVITI